MTVDVLDLTHEGAVNAWKTRRRKKADQAGQPAPTQPTVAPTETKSGLSPKMLTALGQGIVDCFNFGKAHGHESAIVIDDDGNRIGMQGGSQHTVSISLLLNGKEFICIHNHPSPTTFSEGDIGYFINSKLAHEVVVDSKGRVRILSKPEGWRIPTGAHDWSGEYSGVLAETYHQNTGKWPMGADLLSDPAYREARETAVADVAKYLGLIYKKSDINEPASLTHEGALKAWQTRKRKKAEQAGQTQPELPEEPYKTKSGLSPKFLAAMGLGIADMVMADRYGLKYERRPGAT